MTCGECTQPVFASGLCRLHYSRRWTKANPEKVAAYRQAAKHKCERETCGNLTQRRWCRDCAPRFQRKRPKGTPWVWERLPNGGASYNDGELMVLPSKTGPGYVWRTRKNVGWTLTLAAAKRNAMESQ